MFMKAGTLKHVEKQEESLGMLKKVSDKAARVKRASKLLSREVKSKLKNQFHKRGQTPIAEIMYEDKKFGSCVK